MEIQAHWDPRHWLAVLIEDSSCHCRPRFEPDCDGSLFIASDHQPAGQLLLQEALE